MKRAPITEKERATAFQHGRDARHAGTAIADCPHGTHPLRSCWVNGWYYQRDQDEQHAKAAHAAGEGGR